MVTAPWDVEQVRDRVDKRVAEYLHAHRPQLDEISPDAGALADPLADFLAGGKRLRAVFLYWGWRAGGGADTDAAISAAAALEFLQACALIHDDVMDDSDRRRGRPAIHRQFAALHRTADWAGSAERFGVGAAILLGDLCLSWADELLLTSGLPAAALERGKPVYDAMRLELMAGQYLDILEQARRSNSVAAALNVATYKSAKYTIERPLHLGAVLAAAPPATAAALRSYGLALGRAFQLRDDVLGVFGDPARTGKPSGDDLREGKRTVLTALALEELGPAAAAELRTGLEQPPSDTDPDRLARLLASTSARERVERMIAEYTAAARRALAEAALAPEPAAVLTDLAAAATDRQA